MQFAERWLGFGTIAAAVVLVHVAVLAPHGGSHYRHRRHHHHHSVDLAPHGCTDGPRMVAPPPIVNPAPPPILDSAPPPEPSTDRYAMVFEHAHAQFQKCFTTETRADLLISIAADGRVTSVSHRPGPSTPASRCLEPIVKQLRFPPADVATATRVLLTSE